MIRIYLSTNWAALVFLAVGAVSGQIAAAVEPARALETSSAGQRPALAVIASVDETLPQGILPIRTNREDLEDLLVMEIGNQPFLKLVNRQSLEAVMKEHAIALSNLGEASKAVALGKFAGADYLLHVVVMKDTASARLVETATGQVKLDEEVKLNADLALFAVAVREKVLAVLRPESKISNYLTVGITEFPNRSGNPTSDKLGLELQTALRKRLKNQSWAVVLERQYPTALLEEVDLARMGFTRGKGAESLPPADFVILGSLEDAGREYEPGKPWEVRLRLTLRLRGWASQIEKKCRSDAIESAAEDLLREIDAFRREKPLSEINVPEKELWRRQAFYIMPDRCETWGNAIVPNFCAASQAIQLETLRAWENVLLLDGDDPEAMTYLGVCLIGFNWSNHSKTGDMRCIAGSRLVERAYRRQPNKVRAKTYVACIKIVMQAAPARAKEMAQYVVDHPKEFKQDASMWWVKRALSLPDTENGMDADSYLAAWKRAIENSRQDPETLLYAFTEERIDKPFPVEQAATFLTPYLDSPDPLIQFLAHRTIGEFLLKKKKDPAALEHFDKAISLLDEVFARCKQTYYLNTIYQRRIEAGKIFDRVEEANKIALAGARRFLKAKRFDSSIAWLYLYCATDVLRDGEEKEAIAFCDAYLATVKKTYWADRNYWPQIAAKREELLAKASGKPVPDMSSLRLAKGTEGNGFVLLRMAATDGKLWLVSGTFPMDGKAMIYLPGRDEVVPLADLQNRVGSVVALNDSVFFGTSRGIYKSDGNGALAKHYGQMNSSLAGSSILDLCEGGGKIYFSFHGSPRQGVAVLDPDSEKVTVLAPSTHDATIETEPLMNIQRLRWDAAAQRLHAFEYGYWYQSFPMLVRNYQGSPDEKAWHAYKAEKAPCMVVSHGDKTLVVQGANDRMEFRFVKSGQKVKATVPASQLMGDPAFDDDRIWVPTSSGLYEIDRATGRVTWLAYDDGNWFLSVLKAGNRLYVATSRGLYYREIPLAQVKE